MNNIIQVLTSGESHGKSLNAIIEGLPSGIPISVDTINNHLALRQQGYGRGARQKIETDKVEIKSGLRFGLTTGAPICLEILNKDFQNWENVMSTSPLNITDEISKELELKTFSKLRPGHADYAGAVKYDTSDLRNILERSSARKTAMDVAVGSICSQVLAIFGIESLSSVIRVGKITTPEPQPEFDVLKELISKSDLRCWDEDTTALMKSEIDNAKSLGTTLGGEVQIQFKNLPIGLGSFVSSDRAIDGLIAQAVMSVPAIKSVEFGLGKKVATLYGKEVHDPFKIDNDVIVRTSNNAGGVEGGMTNGEPLVVTASMKPIPTMRTPLPTVDLLSRTNSEAHFERSDTCAISACAIVVEMKIALVILNEFLRKFGGDSLKELKAHYGR
jgi:chorismate synthase